MQMNRKWNKNTNQSFIDQQLPKFFVFKQNSITKNEKNIKKVLKLLDKENWVLDLGVYSNCELKTYMGKIVQARTLKIWLAYNARPSILLQILTINFPYLKELSLAHNQIFNIEALSFLSFSRIQELQLRQNVITSIKSLTRLKTTQLKTLSLYQNFNFNMKPMTYLTAFKLKTLWIEYEDQQVVQGESLSWLSKIQANQLKQIALGSSSRLKQNRVYQNIFKKYINLKMYRSLK